MKSEMETNEILDREINVNVLIKATDDAIPICHVGEMRPIYQQGPDGMVYSCAMSAVDRQQGFMNGIPYCGASFIPVVNGITGKTSDLRGLSSMCIQGCSVDLNNVIIVPPDFQKR